jgi:hypothetical protein
MPFRQYAYGTRNLLIRDRETNLRKISVNQGNRDSSVGIATGYGIND